MGVSWKQIAAHDLGKVYVCVCVCVCVYLVAQLCLTPCDPMDRSLPGSSVQYTLPKSKVNKDVHWELGND